jgi:hypothetical protein
MLMNNVKYTTLKKTFFILGSIVFVLGFVFIALPKDVFACHQPGQFKHRDHFFSGEGSFSSFSVPQPFHAEVGAAGPLGGTLPGAYDHIFVNDLDPGRYRVEVFGKYEDQPDEHLIIESSTQSKDLLDLNDSGCPEGGTCWGGVDLDSCDINGVIEIRPWSEIYPAVCSLHLYTIEVNRIGDGSCGAGSPAPPAPPGAPPAANNLQVNELPYCAVPSPPIQLRWNFNDPGDTQFAYQVQIDTNAGFSSVDIDSCVPASGSCGGSISKQYTPLSLAYDNTRYYWRVKVWDSEGLDSGWVEYNDPGDSDGDGHAKTFTTDAHPWPNPTGFSWNPANPVVGDPIQFDDGNPFHALSTGPYSWLWDFGDGGTSSLENPVYTYTAVVDSQITLQACDELGCCSAHSENPLSAALPLPWWKEISPF